MVWHWTLLLALCASTYTLGEEESTLPEEIHDENPEGDILADEGDVQADPGYYHHREGFGSYGEDYGRFRKKGGYHNKRPGSYYHHQRSCGKLVAPKNSATSCANGICIATCYDYYTFPTGETSLTFQCQEGHWVGQGLIADAVAECHPSCVPICQNGGRCVSPNVCHCPDLFFGPYCQYERKPCFDLPQAPMNSQRICSADTCTIQCYEGHEFHDGSSVATVICKDGEWRPARTDWTSIPDCLGVCTPPCQHGGICYGFNVCQCPKEFRGLQCQYSKDVCDVRNLGFNGNYNCSGDEETWNCILDCPLGMKFISQPAPMYTCRYETGVFTPHIVPTCIFETGHENYELTFFNPETSAPEIRHEIIVHESNRTSTYISSGQDYESKKGILIQKKKVTGGTCLSWRKEHFKTFDGKILSFKSDCVYNLVSNDDNTFHIQTPVFSSSCDSASEICASITVFINDKEYKILVNGNGKPVMTEGTEIINVPSQVPGMKVDLGSKAVKATLQAVGVTFVWNLKDVIEVKVSESSWNKTSGLCGRMDGSADNELESLHNSIEEYASSARVLTTGEVCQEKIFESHICSDAALLQNAQEFCSTLLLHDKFKNCHETVSADQYYEACLWDYCSCESTGSKDCGCETIAMYAKECKRKGIEVTNWRQNGQCGISCEGGRVFSECGSETPCGGAEREGDCEEGCFCPAGTFVHNNSCVDISFCPCSLRGREFPPGSLIPKDCNTCTCMSGSWSCTNAECGAQCEAVGDPHYKTFDKRKYDFMGKCSYYLLKMDNYSIEAENVACDGAISENLGFAAFSIPGMPSCTKAVTVRLGKTALKLKQKKEVTVNGEEVKLPISLKNAYVSHASSVFVLVELEDGVEVWWDGATSVYINAPPALKGKTKGLCGTFNGNQKDDFLTPEGDIEQNPVSFANKWKIKESCENDKVEETSPCEINVQNKAEAEKYCSKITSNLFLDCHFHVDPVDYYQNCMFDMCSCSRKKSECFCPIISAYAKECAAQGIPIDWRTNVRECGIQCPRGQSYETCGKSCTRSCVDISRQKKCSSQLCMEGCSCPPGFTLDHREVCIPISSCPCILNGLQYPPGHAEIRPASKGLELCTCTNALWECHLANGEEIQKYPNNSFEVVTCSSTKNQEYSHCEPSEPVTCQNMHSTSHMSTPSICYGGCVCKKGYVLDSLTKDCVKPEDCPCHHGGQSYTDGSQIQEDCNTCVCNQGKWVCTDHECPGICTAWGDSHFQTFDDKLYDFQGTCDYILVKGASSKADCFSVAIEMASCGSTGVSCSKAVKVSVGAIDNKESITLADGVAHGSNSILKRLTMREMGLYIFVDIADLGVVVQWDKGSRVSVRVDPKWKGKVHGLCGNYNGDTSDDFITPSGGVSEVSPQIFGDSWKLHDYCPQSQPVKDACAIHPSRKSWSVEKCSILKSNIFKPCHSEVPLDFYLEKCIFDSCACDQGGDCECLCTAVSAYAQECNSHGVHIKWRKQDFCPIQCDETCSYYSPCITTCPPETCDNYLNHKALTQTCNQDVCIEGCKLKPCPEGQIYKNASYSECVPIALCKPVCLSINGTDYYEGDFIEGDGCYSCYCSRNAKSCSGVPCTPSPPIPSPVVYLAPYSADIDVCVSGWTEWINNSPLPDDKFHEYEAEPIPTFQVNNGSGPQGPHCKSEFMTDIKCRTIRSHMSPKETGQDVECSLEKGLVCKNGCSDFEIQVYCQCEETTLPPNTPPSEPSTIPSTAEPTLAVSIPQIITTEPTTAEPTTEASTTEITFGPTSISTTESVCNENEIWDECAYECDKLCLYFEYSLYQSGTCLFSQKCSPGCRPKDRVACTNGYKWRDANTCVKEEDCTCRSHTGEMVKPGKVVNETECKLCQCLVNHYSCDDSACYTTSPPEARMEQEPTPSISSTTVIVVSTVTPPADTCSQNRFTPLLNDVPDTGFTSSSIHPNPNYAPQNIRLTSVGNSWRPEIMDENQYVQIDLGHVDIIYGINIKGDIQVNDYVTRYYVLFSVDNIAYSYVTLHDKPQLFFGPSFHLESKFQVFSKPFEARYVRVNPVAWVGAPALKLELMGCESLTPTPTSPPTTMPTTLPPTTTPTTTAAPVCLDKMSNHMNDEQVSASSSTKVPLLASVISVYEDEGWIPLESDRKPWLQFDFLGERTLTGVMIGGSGFKLTQVDLMPSWVTKFYITYSHDQEEWNPIVYEDGSDQIFSGNEDNNNIKTIIFRIPIRGRYVRIIPVEWHNKITLRVQLLGCYEPYPILTTTTEATSTTKKPCNLCTGAVLTSQECPCSPPLYWDGEQCTTRSQCPCYFGYIAYAVGTTYENDKCEQCICGLTGLSQCRKKECPPCGEGLKKELTASCACICKPCEAGQRLCPSSSICINETAWCDGVSDCIDDELDCQTSPPTTTSTSTTTTVQPPTTAGPKECPPPPECKPGTKLEKLTEPEKKAPFWTPFGSQSKWGSYFKGNPRERQGFGARHKGARKSKKGHKGHKGHKGGMRPIEMQVEEPVCGKYICSCVEKPECPPGSKLEIIKATVEGECDQFSCPVPPDKTCFVNGRTFTTFDGVEYKYDICDHIIARDRVSEEWEIREVKTCAFIGPCEKHLLINYDNHTIRLNMDNSIVFDGYGYTVAQMQKIGSQSQEFAMKQVNNRFTIFSSRLGFSLIWDSQANIKVVVPGTANGEVDGLCGFMDDNPINDKQKPNGELAVRSDDFGDSWGKRLDCETKACPAHIQKEAFKMCEAIRYEPLSQCSDAINLDKLHSQCVESICLCSEHSNSTEACRCDAILKSVSDCQVLLPSIDFSSWRVQNDCPVECPPGLVFKECFKRTCEPCCGELLTPDACPETNECFPGCYCPDGYVRSYDQCVKPSECRDCICEGYGSSRFVTFDKLDYTYNGNCTHILAQTLKNGSGPQFKVLLTTAQCEDDPGSSCLSKITILYKENTVQAISKDKSILVSIDGIPAEVPTQNKWVSVTELFGKGINIHLPKLQLDLEISNDGKNYQLKLPSHWYANRTEGLCGSCNVNTTDDLKMSNDTITENIGEFAESWRVKDLPKVLEKEDSCVAQNIVEECLPPPPDQDKCLILMDEKLFGKCHAVIDPSIFVANCHDAYCHGVRNFCRELEEYAVQCQAEGICLEWRSQELCPFSCPPGLEYEACGLGCTETCDNYELYRTSPEKCQTPRGDTCTCPHGQVLKNGSCIEESRCSPCDTEGHFPGDKWNPDSCTICTCDTKSVQCERIQCPPKQSCELGSKLIVVPGTETDCCPQHICAPQPVNETCPPPQKMKCGQDQILKVEINKNGCEGFICCCRPKEECINVTQVVANMTLEPGFVTLIDDSGCCPFVNKTCQPSTCPTHLCPEFQVPVKKGDGVCCPIYDCEIPKDHCLYVFTQEGSTSKGHRTLKAVGDVWKDGACRTCECRPGSTVASCTEQFCQAPPESENYVYEAVSVNNKCCPIYKRKACKVDNKEYSVGDTWYSESNPCKNTSCIIGKNGEVSKEDSVQSCSQNCKKGFEYVPPPSDSRICCGECKPIGCLVNGTLYSHGDTWQSTPDNCTTYTCLIEDGQVHVVTSKVTCPQLDDCSEENVYIEGCCKKCNNTPAVMHSACTAEPVPLNATIRLVQVFDEERGPCANVDPIIGFKECKGICDSFTEFDWRTGQHESNCLCCQGEAYETVSISLDCADGTVLSRDIPVPSACKCLTCAGPVTVEKPQKLISQKTSAKKTFKGKTTVKL